GSLAEGEAKEGAKPLTQAFGRAFASEQRGTRSVPLPYGRLAGRPYNAASAAKGRSVRPEHYRTRIY
ncbi:MAG: hypothetical protein ABEJ77_07385, partial [Halanaeroarchaeum sp.]